MVGLRRLAIHFIRRDLRLLFFEQARMAGRFGDFVTESEKSGRPSMAVGDCEHVTI